MEKMISLLTALVLLAGCTMQVGLHPFGDGVSESTYKTKESGQGEWLAMSFCCLLGAIVIELLGL